MPTDPTTLTTWREDFPQLFQSKSVFQGLSVVVPNLVPSHHTTKIEDQMVRGYEFGEMLAAIEIVAFALYLN
jgi:hypothetical protein